MTYWKFLNEDGTPCHGGVGRWTVGEWREVTGQLVCGNGIHACREADLVLRIGPALHPIALSGEAIAVVGKVVARAGCVGPRLEGWNAQTQRLFAADCAARVKHHVRSRRASAAIVIVRAYAFGLVGGRTRNAAGNAAGSAASWFTVAEGVAGYAAEHAASARLSTTAAALAAGWAERAVAGAAAGEARVAGVAEGLAERAWQNSRLLAYACGGIDLDACRQQTVAALPAALEAIGLRDEEAE